MSTQPTSTITSPQMYGKPEPRTPLTVTQINATITLLNQLEEYIYDHVTSQMQEGRQPLTAQEKAEAENLVMSMIPVFLEVLNPALYTGNIGALSMQATEESSAVAVPHAGAFAHPVMDESEEPDHRPALPTTMRELQERLNESKQLLSQHLVNSLPHLTPPEIAYAEKAYAAFCADIVGAVKATRDPVRPPHEKPMSVQQLNVAIGYLACGVPAHLCINLHQMDLPQENVASLSNSLIEHLYTMLYGQDTDLYTQGLPETKAILDERIKAARSKFMEHLDQEFSFEGDTKSIEKTRHIIDQTHAELCGILSQIVSEPHPGAYIQPQPDIRRH